MTLCDDAKACGASVIEIQARKTDKVRLWSWRGKHYRTPEELASSFLKIEGYVDVLHYPYVQFPHGPTREYAPVYEICRAALWPSFSAILHAHFPDQPLIETQNFFGMGNYRASIEMISENFNIFGGQPPRAFLLNARTFSLDDGIVSPSRSIDVAIPLGEIESAAQHYDIRDFRRNFVAYRKAQLGHVRECRKLESVKNEELYDPDRTNNSLLDSREKQLTAMSTDIFDAFVGALGQSRFSKILIDDLVLTKFPRSDYYNADEQRIRGLYNKVVGWPDLTTVRNGEVHLYEVKVSDRLRKAQKTMIDHLVHNVGIAVSIIHIKQR